MENLRLSTTVHWKDHNHKSQISRNAFFLFSASYSSKLYIKRREKKTIRSSSEGWVVGEAKSTGDHNPNTIDVRGKVQQLTLNATHRFWQ